MANFHLSIYVKDEDAKHYLDNKTEMNAAAKDAVINLIETKKKGVGSHDSTKQDIN